MVDKKIQQQARKDILNNSLFLAKSHNILGLLFATGTGKSYISLKIGEEFKAKKILILHYETTHRQNWINEINKHGFNLSTYTFSTYASIHKLKDSFDYIIADEAHHLTNQKLLWWKNNITSKKISFLSTTLNKEKKENLNTWFSNIKFYEIPLKKANKLGYKPYAQIAVKDLDKLPLEDLNKQIEYYLIQKWLREDYNIHICTSVRWNNFEREEKIYDFWIKDTREVRPSEKIFIEPSIKSYEEALEKGLHQALILIKS